MPELDLGRLREQRIWRAVATGTITKVITFISHLAVIALASRSLGVGGFGAVMVIGSALTWISLTHQGLGPEITRRVGGAAANGDQEAEATYFWAGLLILCFVAVVFLSIGWTVVSFSGLATALAGKLSLDATAVRHALQVALLVLGVEICLSIGEATRTAYQDVSTINLFAALGQVIGVLGASYAAFKDLQIVGWILALYAPPAVARLANLLHLLICRGYLIRYCRNAMLKATKTVRTMVPDSAVFGVMQLAAWVNQQGSIQLAGIALGAEAAGIVAVISRLGILLGGLIGLFVRPLLPALIDAYHMQDLEWIKRIVKHARKAVLVIGGLIFVGVLVGGDWFLELLTGERGYLAEYALRGLVATLFVVNVWCQLHGTILIGLNRHRTVAIIVAIENSLLVVLIFIVWDAFGLSGLYGAIVLAGIATSAWLFPRILRPIVD